VVYPLLVFLLLIVWGPSVMVLRKNGVVVLQPKILSLLAAQVLVLIVLAFLAETIGLLNPGGNILAITVLVSGFSYLGFKYLYESGN
jgi:hypothetical protein